METQLAESVLKQMAVDDNLFVPQEFIHGRYIFFAIDNVDFQEDTPDGKRTTHATAMVIYQQSKLGFNRAKLEIDGFTQRRSTRDLPIEVTCDGCFIIWCHRDPHIFP